MKTLIKIWDCRYIFLFIFCTGITYPWWLTSEKIYIIKDKEVKEKVNQYSSNNEGKDQYLVYTDLTTLKIEDTYWYLNFSSSDLWGKLKVGKSYRIKTYGIRLGWMSWYPNVVSYQEI
jgi:hypothetical protein